MHLHQNYQVSQATKTASATDDAVCLRGMVDDSEFREDLYYRLTVVEIKVPPLRERKSDIPLLVDRFLQKYGMEYRDRLLRMDSEALKILERYSWPGNIRELENVVQRAVIMADGPIGVKDLPDFLKYEIEFPEEELMPLRDMERQYIKRVLLYAEGNKTKAAKILKISRKTLRDKLD